MTFVNAPIHDLLIRIKNAYLARRYVVNNVVYSKFKVQVLDLLQRFKFISSYEINDDSWIKTLSVFLNTSWSLNEDVPVIKFYSKPSRRWYIWWKEIHPVAWWIWIGILSTSQWLMAAHEAKKKKIWWELIAEIY